MYNYIGDKMSSIPNQVAIILDSNGRWDKMRSLNRSLGHKEDFKNLKNCQSIYLRKVLKY